MSDVRIRAQQNNVGRTSDGNLKDVRGTRDGTPFTADWYLALALEGRCFTVNFGEGTDPVAFGAAFDIVQQDLFVHVPDATVIIPVFLQIAVQDTTAAGALQDIVAVASNVSDAAVTGTSQTIYNKRSDAPFSSNCTANGSVTGAGTSPYTGNYDEFWRPEAMAQGDSAAVGAGIGIGNAYAWKWSAAKAGIPPIIVGTGSLSIWCSNAATAQTGFIIATWVELPETAIV
jgi:hypothetical protein